MFNQFSDINDFIDWIRRQLGEPLVKVELTDQQIVDNIYASLEMFIKYASAQATEEQYFTLMVSGGQADYELPMGVVDVLDFEDEGYGDSGINTLFTIENQMYNAGMLDFRNLSWGLTMVTYHMALDFMETISRYTTTSFSWTYDSDDRMLRLDPTPKHDSMFWKDPETGVEMTVDSPGWILLKVKVLKGAFDKGFTMEKAFIKLFNKKWVREYTLALCKITLAMVRRKFENFASVGNTGINLDGGELMSEGKEEKERLEEDLQQKESYEGYGIITGIV